MFGSSVLPKAQHLSMFKHKHMFMAVKTITITTQAYEAIKHLKKAEESFSELFLRISPRKLTIKDIAGILQHTPEQTKQWQERIRQMRREFDEGMEKRIEDVRTRLKRAHRSN